MSAFNKSWHYIRRSPYQALAAIAIMMLTFMVGSLVFLAGFGSTMALSYFESKPQLVVFFQDTKSKEDIDALGQTLKNTNKVKEVTYVSKEDALALYRQWYQNDPLLLEMVTAEILPQSLEISAVSPADLSILADMVRNEPGVEDIEYQADVVKSLVSWTRIIRIAGGGLVIFLAFESLLVIVTVIGMKIALRREEIEILQLIGATRWYIGKPFLIEGTIYGVIGAMAGWLAAFGTLLWASPFLRTILNGIPIDLFNPIFLSIFWVGILLLGGLLGLIGASLALLRFLR